MLFMNELTEKHTLESGILFKFFQVLLDLKSTQQFFFTFLTDQLKTNMSEPITAVLV